jgi:hypothetical protein
MVRWRVLVYYGRKEPPLLCGCLSLSLQRKYRREGGRTTHLCCSFPHSRQQLSFPGQCTALQIIDHLPALGAGFSLLGSPNKQAESFGVLVFRCRGLFCGLCVFFWDHPCYWFLDLCFPRWVLVAESMGRRKLVGDWLNDWLTDLAWWGRIGCQDNGGFTGGRGL